MTIATTPTSIFANRQERKCQKCSVREECAWNSNATRSARPPVLKRDYWAAAQDPLEFAGYVVYQCLGPESCLRGGVCAEGRISKACGDCIPGYFGTTDGPCRPCELGKPEIYWTLTVVAFVAFTFFLILAHEIQRRHGRPHHDDIKGPEHRTKKQRY